MNSEQYIWVTFGRRLQSEGFSAEIKNGAVTLGLGNKYTDSGYVTNSFLSFDGVKQPWSDYKPFDIQKQNHGRLTVKEGKFAYYINGNLIFENVLPEKYEEGFVGIGTNCSGAIIANLKISGNCFPDDDCRYFPDVVGVGSDKMPVSVFYSAADGVYERSYNGSGNWSSGVAMLFSKNKYYSFELDFEFKFENISFNTINKSHSPKDPFGEYTFGPYPQRHFVDWAGASDFTEAVWHKEALEIKINVMGAQRPLYISAPSVGGVRISTEYPSDTADSDESMTAVFEPESNISLTPNDEYEITGADGTKVIFHPDKRFWRIDLINAKGKHIFSIHKWNIMFADDRGTIKQYRLLLPLQSDESVFGTGERFSEFEQRGKRIAFWNTDPCYHWYDNADNMDLWRGYKNVPLIHLSRGCSIFFNTTCNGIGDFGCTEKNALKMEFDDYRLDMYFWTGEPESNIEKYTSLTGKPFLPPEWAFHFMAGGSNGFWQCPADDSKPENYIPKLEKLIEGYSKLNTKPYAIYGEGAVGKNPQSYKLAEEIGSRMLCWQCADCPERVRSKVRPGIPADELPLAKRINNLKEPFYFIDFPNENSLSLMKDMYGDLIKSGLSGGMVDFAELVPIDALFSNGLLGDRMHNFFAYWYARAYNRLYSSIRDDDFLCYIRGGCAGSQKWLATWCGDQFASFDGLKQQLACGLSISASGFSVWGGDMACLCGKPSEELFIRGNQFSTFQPLMRVGGDATKQPWDYGEKAVGVHKTHYWLRENLASMLYSGAVLSHKTGKPMTEAMALAFPECKEATGNGEQYILCGNILVSPVTEAGVTEKQVYFPNGKWYSLFSNELGKSGLKNVSAPIEYSPAFLKSGAVVPVTVGKELELMREFKPEEAHCALLVTPPEKTESYRFYFDEERFADFVCEKNSYNEFSITVSGADIKDIILMAKAESVSVNGESLNNTGYKVCGCKTKIHSDSPIGSMKITFKESYL